MDCRKFDAVWLQSDDFRHAQSTPVRWFSAHIAVSHTNKLLNSVNFFRSSRSDANKILRIRAHLLEKEFVKKHFPSLRNRASRETSQLKRELCIRSQKMTPHNGFETISCSGSESSSGTTAAVVNYGPFLLKYAIISAATLCVGDGGDSKVGTCTPKSRTSFQVDWWAPDNHLQNRWWTKYRRFGSPLTSIFKKTKPIGRCPTKSKVVLGRRWCKLPTKCSIFSPFELFLKRL